MTTNPILLAMQTLTEGHREVLKRFNASDAPNNTTYVVRLREIEYRIHQLAELCSTEEIEEEE